MSLVTTSSIWINNRQYETVPHMRYRNNNGYFYIHIINYFAFSRNEETDLVFEKKVFNVKFKSVPRTD